MTTTLQAAPRSPPIPRAFDHISYSSISTFQTCPQRFEFRYILGLPEHTVSSSLVFGSALHRSVQFHFEQLMVGRSTDLDTLLEVFQDGWESYSASSIAFGKGEDRNSIGSLADRLLSTFLKSDFAHPQGEILGVEEELRGQIIPGCPDLLARVDLIVDTGRDLVVSDFKTSRSSWSENKVEDIAPQLLLYSELVKPLANGKPIKLAFAVATKTKVPALTLHEVPCDPKQVIRTKRTVDQVWRAIQVGHFYPVPSLLNCGSCAFREPCRTWVG